MCTHSENMHNRDIFKNNTSEAKGIMFTRGSNSYEVVKASISKDNKIFTKTFLIKKYGKDLAFKHAIVWRQRIIAELKLNEFSLPPEVPVISDTAIIAQQEKYLDDLNEIYQLINS